LDYLFSSIVFQMSLYISFGASNGKVCVPPHLGHFIGTEKTVAPHSISKSMNTLWQSVQRKGILPRIITLYLILSFKIVIVFGIRQSFDFLFDGINIIVQRLNLSNSTLD